MAKDIIYATIKKVKSEIPYADVYVDVLNTLINRFMTIAAAMKSEELTHIVSEVFLIRRFADDSFEKDFKKMAIKSTQESITKHGLKEEVKEELNEQKEHGMLFIINSLKRILEESSLSDIVNLSYGYVKAKDISNVIKSKLDIEEDSPIIKLFVITCQNIYDELDHEYRKIFDEELLADLLTACKENNGEDYERVLETIRKHKIHWHKKAYRWP